MPNNEVAVCPKCDDFQRAESKLTHRERTKREKYETSRPYDEAEKVNLVRYALYEVFVTVPAVRLAATRSLRDLGATVTTIEFSAPDAEERAEASYTHDVAMEPSVAEDLSRRFAEFDETLSSCAARSASVKT